MGTSKSGSGIIGTSQLLPDWAPPPEQAEEEEAGQQSREESEDVDPAQESTIGYTEDFRTVKGALTRYVNNPSRSSLKSAAKKYIRKTGGIKNATSSASMGIKVGRGYINFLNSLQTNGYSETLKQLGLGVHIGKSSEEVLAIIADSIAPNGSTNDEAIARDAVLIATEKLYERLEENQQDFSSLDSLNEELFCEVLIEYVSAYIFKKWVYEAGMAIENNILSEKKAIDLEIQMKDFVRQEVKDGINEVNIKNFDLSSGQGRNLMVEIFELAYTTLEK